MAGIYLHIPFCKQACSYCNFHFTTSLRRKNELVAALLSELEIRQTYLGPEMIDTIYFGGGTPSLLEASQINTILEKITTIYKLNAEPEITIETNPDDSSEEMIKEWRKIGVNRLSIGIQSFYDEDLLWMNRAHRSKQSHHSLQSAVKHFDNITIDLIYGMPGLTNGKWKTNVDTAVAYGIPHLSCYALTVELKTPLEKLIKEKKTADINPGNQSDQFLILMQWMNESGYEHYEISNFAKPGFRSRHNSLYWSGKKYLGIGPAAHSFDGTSRQWNASNNNIYIDSINKKIIPSEREILTPTQQVNEYIMTSLRTIEGLDLDQVEESLSQRLRAGSQRFIENGWMINEGNHLKLTKEGKLFADGIAADLFLTNDLMPRRKG